MTSSAVHVIQTDRADGSSNLLRGDFLSDGRQIPEVPESGFIGNKARRFDQHAHIRGEITVLSELLALHGDRAGGGPEQAADQLEQHRLAGAVSADKADDLAVLDGQAGILQDGFVLEGF